MSIKQFHEKLSSKNEKSPLINALRQLKKVDGGTVDSVKTGRRWPSWAQ